MKKQKTIRTIGLGLMIFSIVFMSYKYNKNISSDTSYIVMGLVATIIGALLVQYGSKKRTV